MDSTQPQAATSSSSTSPAHTEDPASSEPKVLRTSARVKAAKQKEKTQRTQQDATHPGASSSTKRSRDNKGKGKETADEARASKRCVGTALGMIMRSDFAAAPVVLPFLPPPLSLSTNRPRIRRARSAQHPKTPLKTTNSPHPHLQRNCVVPPVLTH